MRRERFSLRPADEHLAAPVPASLPSTAPNRGDPASRRGLRFCRLSNAHPRQWDVLAEPFGPVAMAAGLTLEEWAEYQQLVETRLRLRL